ncbi:MAG: hypothetical protein AAGD25_15085 [Cyanobacteria bacterium P01_F01_bin.150]
MKFAYFDPKTGQPLFDTVEGVSEQRWKESKYSFLEHWLDQHHLPKDDFWVGTAYQSDHSGEIDTTLEQQRLEQEGKYLIFTNGKDGYFASQEMAQLMSEGDPSRGIGSIFANNRNSPHNYVAYGSLVASDGIEEVSLGNDEPSEAGHSVSLGSKDKSVRILVIDDENRSHGDETLSDRRGREVSAKDLSKLYDKMGDGTMLVSPSVMRSLVRDEEQEQLMAQAMKKAGVSEDITDLSDTALMDQAVADGERRIDRFAGRLVSQFRAASTDPDMPGIAKGTMQSSCWAERLGVDAIISTNDIKGDDGKFSTPGIHEVSDFWINRKSDAQHGTQVVGPQVKGTIPEATLQEFNPRMKEQAEKLASVASDPQQLLAYYVEKKDLQQRLQPEDELDERSDWIYDAAKADTHGVLTGFSKLNRGLDKFLRRERVDVATHGISVPSAMAQHHSQLKPWEVANKDLPQDAIVAYYRSPFPNVGAAAIAINNPAAIQAADPEAFAKHGVAYLNPKTAKNIAITDFDSDANGYFVGYEATESGLADRMREQLSDVEERPFSEQYEAGRSLIAQMINESERLPEPSAIRPVEDGYPLAVKEFVERNAPDRKPAEIKKQPKIKHPWHESERRESATYRAWQVTANNPTGKAANLAMTLRSLADQTRYVPPEKQEGLVNQISKHFQGVRKQVETGRLTLPSNTELDTKGFPPYHLDARVQSLADAAPELSRIHDPKHRQSFIQDKLDETHSLLTDLVDGPLAVNLQTAVDVAKSARGIDEDIHHLAKRFAYQKDALRDSHKDHRVYTGGMVMPTSIDDPINWAVQEANQLYEDSQLPELPNASFKELFPKHDLDGNPSYTNAQASLGETIASKYNALNADAVAARERLRGKAERDAQPTLLVETEDGRQLQVEKILESDPSQRLPIWRSQADQHLGDKIELHNVSTGKEQTINAVLDRDGTRYDLCPISLESINAHQLDQRMRPGQAIIIANPSLTIQPAYAIQNDADEMFERASEYLDSAIDGLVAEERMPVSSGSWRNSHSMGPVLKRMTPELTERLQSPIPAVKITGLQHHDRQYGSFEDGQYKIRFNPMTYKQGGKTVTNPGIFLLSEDGEETSLGKVDERHIRPRPGTVAIAAIKRIPDPKGNGPGRVAMVELQQLETDRGWVKNGEQLLEELDASVDHVSENPHYPTGQFVDQGSYYQPTLYEAIKWGLDAASAHNTVEMAFTEQVKDALIEHGRQTTGQESPLPDYTTPEITINMVKFEQMLDLTRQEYEAHRQSEEELRKVTYQPSARDLRQWASDAGSQGDMESVAGFEQMEAALAAKYFEQAEGASQERYQAALAKGKDLEPPGPVDAPDYYRHPSVIVPIEEADRLLHSPEQQASQSTLEYQPTAQELRDWYVAAKQQGDQPKMEAIVRDGGRLKNAWKDKDNQGEMPGDFSHSSVVLDSAQVAQMQQDISAHRQQHSPQRPAAAIR